MTAHTHIALTRGCYRCELNVDEIRSAIDDSIAEAREHEREARELRRDVRDMRRALATWEASADV